MCNEHTQSTISIRRTACLCCNRRQATAIELKKQNPIA